MKETMDWILFFFFDSINIQWSKCDFKYLILIPNVVNSYFCGLVSLQYGNVESCWKKESWLWYMFFLLFLPQKLQY